MFLHQNLTFAIDIKYALFICQYINQFQRIFWTLTKSLKAFFVRFVSDGNVTSLCSLQLKTQAYNDRGLAINYILSLQPSLKTESYDERRLAIGLMARKYKW